MLRASMILCIILCLTAVTAVPFTSRALTGANSPVQTQATPPATPRKRALLVGISDYCRDESGRQCRVGGTDWWDLNSAHDVDTIEQLLMSEQFGFRQDEIKVLKTKAETTHENIVNTFRSFLIEQTVPGDIVYFHFSGHGSQVEDDNKHGMNLKLYDEFDGMDESLIPSDYKAQDDGSNNIRDDEIEQLLAGMPGRHVTLTVDSCFSGTISRGGRSLIRGLKLRRAVPVNSRGAKDGPSGLFAEGDRLTGSLVILSAARNNQVAAETEDEATNKQMGAFSYALVKALRNAGTETTYRDVFERINEEIKREQGEQDPQLEGSRDNILFSGIARPTQPYINVVVEGRKLMLKAGSLQGMTKGSRFSVYLPGKTSRDGSPLAQAEIITIGPTNSVLKVTPDPDDKALETLRTARAVETFHNFGDARLRVLIDEAAKASLGKEGLRQLNALALLNIADRAGDWAVRVCRDRCADEKLPAGQENIKFNGGVTLMRQDGSIIERVPDGPKMPEAVIGNLEGEVRWRFINGLKNESVPSLRIKMRLVPVTDIVQDSNTKLAKMARDLAPEVPLAQDNRLVLHDGDTVMLEVMNLGDEDVFISVLDLRSDGTLGPLFPHPLVPIGTNENVIMVKNDAAGNPVWQRIPFPFVIKIGKPYGPEVFKAILTRSPSDFSPLFSHKDAEDIQSGRRRGTTRGENEAKSLLGQILLTATTGKTRGKTRGVNRSDSPGGETGLFGAEDAANVGVPSEDWATAQIIFEALPPKTVRQ